MNTDAEADDTILRGRTLVLGLNPYGLTYHLGLQGAGGPRANPRGTGLEGFIAIATELGAKALEIFDPWLRALGDDELRALRDRLAALGMTPIVSSGLMMGPFERAMRSARLLEARVIRYGLTTVLCGDRLSKIIRILAAPSSPPSARRRAASESASTRATPSRWRRASDRFGPNSLQGVVFDHIDPFVCGVSEDCLYLNVWTPTEPERSRRLPVMVWIHGGGFVVGSGSEPRYDGTCLAARGLGLVTLNHRLNALGFLAHPELTAESEDRASGSYAMLDLVAALRWVKRNIAAFGGDPNLVTIAGESAGSEAAR